MGIRLTPEALDPLADAQGFIGIFERFTQIPDVIQALSQAGQAVSQHWLVIGFPPIRLRSVIGLPGVLEAPLAHIRPGDIMVDLGQLLAQIVLPGDTDALFAIFDGAREIAAAKIFDQQQAPQGSGFRPGIAQIDGQGERLARRGSSS